MLLLLYIKIYNYKFVYNKKCNLDNSCQTYFPDFLIDCNTFFLIISLDGTCDEFAHSGYDTQNILLFV